jgi:hypothetical protein
MTRRTQRPGGRPEAARLSRPASAIIRKAIDDALDNHNRPSKFLAGTVAGVSRLPRTIRDDLSERSDLKVEAALFLINRAFEEGLIEQREFLRFQAVVALSHPEAQEITIDRYGGEIEGGLFLSRDLEGQLADAIARALPRLQSPSRVAIWMAIENVLKKARRHATQAGVVEAYGDYLRRHAPRMSKGEQQARARALIWARRQLGDAVSGALTGDEMRWYPFLPGEEFQ